MPDLSKITPMGEEIRKGNPLFREYIKNKITSFFSERNLGETNKYYPGSISYLKGYENNPEIVNHEKLHIGQQRVDNPSLIELINEFKNKVPNKQAQAYVDYYSNRNFHNQADELPAYLFDSDQIFDVNTKKLFAAYINKLYSKNPKTSANLEALAPPKLMKDYVTNEPRPILPFRTSVDFQSPTIRDVILNKFR